MSASYDTNFARSIAAVTVGSLVCGAAGGLVVAFRHWAAFGVFSIEDWLRLLPEVSGRLVDFLLALLFGGMIWLILHARNQRDLPLAMLVGALSGYLAPRLFAAVVVLPTQMTYGGVSFLDVFGGSLERIGLSLTGGAAVAAIMWHVAYRRVQTQTDAEVFT